MNFHENHCFSLNFERIYFGVTIHQTDAKSQAGFVSVPRRGRGLEQRDDFLQPAQIPHYPISLS